MKKNLNILLIITILTILSAAAYYLYLKYFKQQITNQALKAVPQDSFISIQTNDMFEAYKEINNTELWQYLIKTQFFADINSDIQTANNYLRATPLPQNFFKNRPLTLTISVTRGSWNYTAIIDLKDLGKITPQLDIILTSIPKFKTSKINYSTDKKHSYLIYKLVYLPNQYKKYFITFADNLLIISPDLNLLKKSLNALHGNSILINEHFQQLKNNLSSNGLLDIIINFNQLDGFVRTFQDYRDPSIQTISEGLGLTVAYITIKHNTLSISGISQIDTLNSYFKALSQTKPSVLSSFQIISDQTAAMVTLNFSNYTQFYHSFMKAFEQEEPRKAYETQKSINILRNINGIDIDQDIFSWIGNEITIFKLSPQYSKRARDIVITIHTTNPILAQQKLNMITKKIADLSPTKFKAINYQGYTINYLKIKNFFYIFFGDLFNGIEKPYFTIIGDYVVFSNSPQTIENVIDDYLDGYTLATDNSFMNFIKNFKQKNTFFAYINTPLLFKNLLFYTSDKDKQKLLDNKDLITGFSQLALQLTTNNDMMNINIATTYNPNASFDLIIKQHEKQTQIEKLLREIDSMKFEMAITDSSLSTGPYTCYYPDTKQIYIQGEIKNGKPFGQWKTFYPDGNLKMTQMFDLDGKFNGLVQIFYDNRANSKLAEFYIKDNKINDTLIQYYKNGHIKAKINYKDGKRHGKALFFSPEGKIQIIGKYSQGKKHGHWKFYDKQGNLIYTQVWRHGEQLK